MPLYEYRCTACGYSFEKIQKFSDTPLEVCPRCEGVLIRPVTAPALRFEGAGWYVNDYAGKGGSKTSEPATATESSSTADASGSKTESKSESKSESKPAGESSAAAPAPAPSTPTSTPSGS